MIGVITYDHPHRKTQDVLTHLKLRGYRDVMVMAIPWIERKNFVPLFNLKPEPYSYWPEKLCQRLDYEFVRIVSARYIAAECQGVTILIAGAPILPEYFVNTNTIINAHCGWLPAVRGLDALKWAIYYDDPIGVTTHLIDADVDIGRKIERRKVSLYPTDDLYSVAMRQYELEIQMLIDAIDNYGDAEPYGEPANEPTRRMPHRLEIVMMGRFKERLLGINE